LESREPLAATRLVTDPDQYVVLTLTPRHGARLFGKGGSAIWESRVYRAQLPSLGIGTQPHYVVLDAGRDDALARHENLLRRLERASFEQETSREILQALRPFADRAGQAFGVGETGKALAALEEALRVAERLDMVRRFLHLYVEIFLMRGFLLERADREAAKAAYREIVALHAEHPLHHPETLRGVAWARAAVERLTPVPFGNANRAEKGSPAAGAERPN
jgi:hypothetical protein